MGYISIRTTVEIDMDDIDTEDLVDELERRHGEKTLAPGEVTGCLKTIGEAFKLNQPDRALELTRALVCETLGVIL